MDIRWVLLMAGCLCVGTIVSAQTYNAAAEFSATSNPTSVWTYGYTTDLGGALNIYTYPFVVNSVELCWGDSSIIQNDAPCVGYNSANTTTSSVPSHTMYVAPGPENQFSHCRFTAPSSGVYKIQSTFSAISYGVPHGYILQNGTSIGDSPLADGTPWTFSANSVALAAGDTIDAAIGVGADDIYYNDTATLLLSITRVGAATLSKRYTALLSATDTGATIPQGTGYATMTVNDKGGVIFAGELPDGEPFSTSGGLSGGSPGNQLVIAKPLAYPSLAYKGTGGFLFGTLTFATLTGTSDFSGTLEWIKPQQTKGPYPAAIDTNLNVIGSRYTPPAKGTSALPGFTNGTLELSSTSFLRVSGTDALYQGLSLSAANAFKVTAPVQNKLKAALTPSTGVFKGSFVYPGQTKATPFAGVLFQDQIIGGGFFVGPDGSGAVSLSP